MYHLQILKRSDAGAADSTSRQVNSVYKKTKKQKNKKKNKCYASNDCYYSFMLTSAEQLIFKLKNNTMYLMFYYSLF